MESEEKDYVFDLMSEGIEMVMQLSNLIIKPILTCFKTHKNDYKIFGEIIEDFALIYEAETKLGENQIVFWDNISIDLAREIIETDNLDGLMLKYHQDNNFESIKIAISECSKNRIMEGNIDVFNEVIKAYYYGLYHLASIGLFALIDFCLTKLTKMDITNFRIRRERIEKELTTENVFDKLDRGNLAFLLTFGKAFELMIQKSDFEKEENICQINRHWLLHGRTQKKYTQIDFIKILGVLYGLAKINDVFFE